MGKEQQISQKRQVLQILESLQAAGVQQLARPSAETLAALQAAAAFSPPSAGPPQPERTPPLHPARERSSDFAGCEKNLDSQVSTAATLEILQSEVAACTRCDELATARTQTVFGVGNPAARLCILGEAPGADEDRLGEPFVGKGGQLLNKILAACKLEREEVYILNVLRCRPPLNRSPSPVETQNCRRFLERQLQLIDPEFICCLGAVAAQNLLSTTVPIGQLRGKVHEYRGIKVVCTYHPAYLLRTPSAKKNTWDDMKLLMREMGTPVA